MSLIKHFHMPKMSYRGICYHGSTYRVELGIFDNLNSDYSEWNAIWVCPEENIAEMFALDWKGEEGVPIVFQVEVNLENAANIRPYDMHKWKELMDYMGINDIRELIPFLKQKGCDGWITSGGIDQYIYFDIAIFSSNVNIKSGKIKSNETG